MKKYPDRVSRHFAKGSAGTNFTVVGIGASAGGLAAFEVFFRHACSANALLIMQVLAIFSLYCVEL